MIPIRDTIPARRTAWVVRLLIAANIAVFVLEWRQGPSVEAFLYRFGVVPMAWTLNAPDLWSWPAQLLTLLTSQFLHGGLLHLASNMLYLWIFGDNVEDRLGHGRFLLFYLGCGVAAAVTQIVTQPHGSVPMIGASGAIAGVLGAYFLLFPHARVVTLIPWVLMWRLIELPAFLFLGVWFALQWVQSLATVGQMVPAGGVAFWAHIGGFITGLVMVWWGRPRRTYF